MSQEACMSRKPWDIAFTADREEVAALRRIMRLHLSAWGLHGVVDEAQLCVSELVTNVIEHVGPGTPATLAVAMRGTRLRVEVHDPETRAFPALTAADVDAEHGRGMALVDAVAEHWGVRLHLDRKVTWCELSTGLTSPDGHVDSPRVTRAESVLGLYAQAWPHDASHPGRLGATLAREAVIDAVTDFLHWLRAHGWDGDEVLDLAQGRFEGEVAG
ncbi:ATP-binding protein [Streptomyces sp. NPDC005017]|uniref:ATP-binding protein n=1 Tax=Streptomyces sp. NPDC005017 TaxID=3364706 RepID=UPI00368EEF70